MGGDQQIHRSDWGSLSLKFCPQRSVGRGGVGVKVRHFQRGDEFRQRAEVSLWKVAFGRSVLKLGKRNRGYANIPRLIGAEPFQARGGSYSVLNIVLSGHQLPSASSPFRLSPPPDIRPRYSFVGRVLTRTVVRRAMREYNDASRNRTRKPPTSTEPYGNTSRETVLERIGR